MKTLQELQAIRDKMKAEIANRGAADGNDVKVVVGMATCGIAAGARPVMRAVLDEVEKRGLTNVKVGQTGCIGICKYEPIVEVMMPGKEKVTYIYVTPDKARQIVSSHLVNGTPIKEYTYSYACEHTEG